MVPFSYSGRIDIHDLHDPKAALLKIEYALDRLRPRRVVRVGQQIQFSAGTLQNLVARNALGAAGSGEVSVQRSKTGLAVTYKVRFTQLFWVSVFMMGCLSMFVLAAPNQSPREGAMLILGMWLWLYGGNVVVTLFKFPKWLRGAVEPS
jgi:hypothetical protein